MKKIIFVTGLANGGKTTTLKELIKKFGRQRLRAKIAISSIEYHVRDESNCDRSWKQYKDRVRELSNNKHLIYPLCLELGYHNNTSSIQDILVFLHSLKQTHELYFFLLLNASDNRKVSAQCIDDLQDNFTNVHICNPSNANMSDKLLQYIQQISKKRKK